MGKIASSDKELLADLMTKIGERSSELYARQETADRAIQECKDEGDRSVMSQQRDLINRARRKCLAMLQIGGI